jgi:hypothetical protein
LKIKKKSRINDKLIVTTTKQLLSGILPYAYYQHKAAYEMGVTAERITLIP